MKNNVIEIHTELLGGRSRIVREVIVNGELLSKFNEETERTDLSCLDKFKGQNAVSKFMTNSENIKPIPDELFRIVSYDYEARQLLVLYFD